MKIFLNTNISDASIERGASASARHFAKLLNQVLLLGSYDALMAFVQKIPADASASFGQELSKAIKEYFIKGVQHVEKKKRQTLSVQRLSGLSFSYELQFKEAIEHFQIEAFEIATVTNIDLMKRLREEALKGLTEGKTWNDFKKAAPGIFQSFGVTSPNAYNLRTNYDTAINGAYMAGQWKRLQSLDYTHLRYMSVGDSHVRPEHRAMHGKTFPMDSPVWDRWYPPAGWNCRCYVTPLNDERESFKISPEGSADNLQPDRNFDNNAGKTDSIFGKYLRLGYGEQISKLDYKSYGLPEWRDIKVSETTPPRVSDWRDKTDAEMRADFQKEFNIVNGEGATIDFEKNIVKVIDKDFKHVHEDGDSNRFQFLPYVKDTLQSPTEVWGFHYKGMSRKTYLKKYSGKNSLVIIQVEDGYLKSWTFIPMSEDKAVDNRRVNVLLKKGD